MNREILRLALPNIVSNVTVPLMGLVSTAIAGHWGDDAARTIGSLAIGVSIFNFIYWNCSFVRMGTSGLTAQAFGAGNFRECTHMLLRAVTVAVALGALILLLQYPIGEAALRVMNGDPLTREYYYVRIWAVPAGILLFALNGWFTGMQNAVIPMWTALAVNAIHLVCSLWFAFGCDRGIVGIACASVAAQWAGVLLSAGLLWLRFRQVLTPVDRSALFDWAPLRRFFAINRDIILRTCCIVAVYTFFTAASARMDHPLLLAVNTLLLQLFTLFSYMNDGFAYAAEALTGRFVGAHDSRSLRRCIRGCMMWGMGVSLLFAVAYGLGWRELLELFVSDTAHAAQLIDLAGRYVVWVIAIPLTCTLPFVLDGIMVGAAESRIMRDSMFLAAVAYFAIYYTTRSLLGNNALWLAFTCYMMLRGVAQYLLSDRLHTIFRAAEK